MKDKFYDTIIRIATSTTFAPNVIISATNMLQLLCANSKHEDAIKSYVNKDMVFANVLTILVKRENLKLQQYVASCVSSLASNKERRSFVVLGGGKKLIELIHMQMCDPHTPLNSSLIHAIFNLSVCVKNRVHLCKIGLKPLLLIARNRQLPIDVRKCAGKTLENLKSHSRNLSKFLRNLSKFIYPLV